MAADGAVDVRFDEILLNLAAQSGGIEPLLRSFFSFLHRKTDFYVVADFNKPGGQQQHVSMGFPPGGAEKILLRAFRSLPYKPLEKMQQGRGGPSSSRGEVRPSAPTTVTRPTAPQSSSSSTAEALPPPPPSTSSARTAASGKGEEAAPAPASSSEPGADHKSTAPGGAGAAATSTSSSSSSIKLTESGKQVPINNGGVTDRYYWSQSLNDVTVSVVVPPGTRSKDVVCSITATRLKVGVKGSAAMIIEGVMPGSVKMHDSLWTIESSSSSSGPATSSSSSTVVVVTLEKTVATWWASVVQGDPEIDTTQVDSTMKVEDYDPQTQGAIRKIMFDQRQKALGLPTSDEMQMQQLLDKARDAPNSPFATTSA